MSYALVLEGAIRVISRRNPETTSFQARLQILVGFETLRRSCLLGRKDEAQGGKGGLRLGFRFGFWDVGISSHSALGGLREILRTTVN